MNYLSFTSFVGWGNKSKRHSKKWKQKVKQKHEKDKTVKERKYTQDLEITLIFCLCFFFFLLFSCTDIFPIWSFFGLVFGRVADKALSVFPLWRKQRTEAALCLKESLVLWLRHIHVFLVSFFFLNLCLNISTHRKVYIWKTPNSHWTQRCLFLTVLPHHEPLNLSERKLDFDQSLHLYHWERNRREPIQEKPCTKNIQ